MFRRTKSADSTTVPTGTATTAAKAEGKGRPTPTRREAEAARKERAKAGTDKKAARKLLRERQAERNAKMRQGMKTCDERFLPARDQGPVRRFVRDFVDARLSVAEFLLPLLIVVMVSQGFAPGFANGLWSATILLTVLDTMLLVFRMKRELKRRFPDESYKGTTFYAILRALQIRWLRLPKPRVKLGAKLPERY